MEDKKIAQFVRILDKLDVPIDLKNSIIERFSLMNEMEVEKFLYILPIIKVSNTKKNLEQKITIYCNNLQEKLENKDTEEILDQI